MIFKAFGPHTCAARGGHRQQVRWNIYPPKVCGPVLSLLEFLWVQFHMSLLFGLWHFAVVRLHIHYIYTHVLSAAQRVAEVKTLNAKIFVFLWVMLPKIILYYPSTITSSTSRCVRMHVSQYLLFRVSKVFLIYQSLPGLGNCSLEDGHVWRRDPWILCY